MSGAHPWAGSGTAVVYLGFLCVQQVHKSQALHIHCTEPGLRRFQVLAIRQDHKLGNYLYQSVKKKKNPQKSQYLRYSYEDNSFSFSAENKVTLNMDNTDIFLERMPSGIHLL